MARKFAAVVFSLGCLQASSSWALGLGEMTLDSYLNEPLQAQVDLLNIDGLHQDQIRIRLATKEDFKRMGVDRAYFLTSIAFNVQIDDNGSARIVITSEDPVLEPYLDFILEARWPSGRLLREYTVLVDPPVFDQVNPVISASSRVAEVDGEPEPAKKNTEVVETTGTRVDVRDSQLAPGEMPSRAFGASASTSPTSGERYMIHRDETLWTIASRARPSGATVNQTMLDIQRLNPDAFIGDNINRIKAGYIIYLPAETDISSGDQSQALAKVRQQNQEWREGRSSEPDYGSGPSLRISAEPEDAESPQAPAGGQVTANAAAMEDMEKAGLERVELEQRLQSMEQQVETLQRIVRLKDDQIAALQGVLTDGQSPDDAVLPDAEAIELQAAEAEVEETAAELETVPEETATEVVAAEAEPVEEEPAPAKVAPAAPQATPEEESPGFFSNLWFILGAVVLAVLGIFVMRRRRAEPDPGSVAEAVAETAPDVFANVELTEQALEVEGDVEPAPADSEQVGTGTTASDRGYGRHKHDEYASDESNDALAEAEIYIAYGRYPQAIDLLKNALVNDSGNAAYRLKLLELYLETGNRAAATEQLGELEAIGDQNSIASARAALDEPATQKGEFAGGAAASSAELLADPDDALQSDFSGLEIEEPGSESVEDELDLSADFDDAGMDSGQLGEELVIAAESDGLSTKLDLARAYMDMGDDDGARQILEEVAAEGNAGLQAEARALLERIG